MILDEMNAIYDPWYDYQQPAHPAPGVSAEFRSLLAAIDQGWQIVDLAQVPAVRPGMVKSYVFTLDHKSSRKPRQLTVMANPAVEQLIGSYGFKVMNNELTS
jgi:hypothetical protein